MGNVNNNKQPSITSYDWHKLFQDGSSVQISPKKKGQGMISALNDFYQINESIFEDKDGDGLTKENALNMYNKLLEIHQRRGDIKDINKISMNSRIYYTKAELTELAEAGGYSIKGANKDTQEKVIEEVKIDIKKINPATITHDPVEPLKGPENIDTSQFVIPTPAVDPTPETDTEDVVDPTPVVKPTTVTDTEDVVDPTPVVKPTTVTDTEDVVDPTPVVKPTTVTDTEDVVDPTPIVKPTTVTDTPDAIDNEPPKEKLPEKTLQDLYKNINVTAITIEQFKAICKQIEESDEFKKLDYSSPEITAYHDWMRVNLEKLNANEFTIPETVDSKEKTVPETEKEVGNPYSDSLPIAFLKRHHLTVEEFKSLPEDEKAKLKAEYDTADSEDETESVEPEEKVEATVKEPENPTAKTEATTNPKPAAPKITIRNTHLKTGYDRMKLEDFIEIGKASIQALSKEEQEKLLNETRNLKPDEFAITFGQKDAKTFASKFDISEQDLEALIKTIDMDEIAFFIGYKTFTEKNKPEATTTPTSTAGTEATDKKTKVKPKKVKQKPAPTTQTTVKPSTELSEETKAEMEKIGPQQISEFISSRADLKGKYYIDQKHILNKELQTLEADPNADPIELDKYRKALAYLSIGSSLTYKDNELNEIIRYLVQEKDGRKIVVKTKAGTFNEPDGEYEFKFIKREGYIDEYIAVPDWSKRLDAPASPTPAATVQEVKQPTATKKTEQPKLSDFDGTPESIGNYVNSRTDLKGKFYVDQRNILKSELDKLKKDPNADPEEIDKYEKAIAYCCYREGRFSKYDGDPKLNNGYPTHIRKTENGQKVALKIKDGTHAEPDGVYGVKFILDERNNGYKYELVPDWENRIR